MHFALLLEADYCRGATAAWTAAFKAAASSEWTVLRAFRIAGLAIIPRPPRPPGAPGAPPGAAPAPDGAGPRPAGFALYINIPI